MEIIDTAAREKALGVREIQYLKVADARKAAVLVALTHRSVGRPGNNNKKPIKF